MTNVMFLGDCHGDRGFTKQAINWAADNGVDRIVQVGDFGFWPRTNNGQRFLHDVGKHSVQQHVPLYWIDGNHEDHLYLDKMLERRNPDLWFVNYGKYPISYIPRGTVWEWGGMTFGAFGGAFSIDRRARRQDSGEYGWFENEMPDPSKIDLLGEVDVLLTHDSPIIPPPVYGHGFKDDVTSRESQRLVYEAMVRSKAKLLVHGHWHVRYTHGVHGCQVEGLAHNYETLYTAAIVLRTDDRRVFTLRQWEYRDADQ